MASVSKTIVLVTGGNRGLGYSIASALLRSSPIDNSGANGAPYHIILTSRSVEKGKEAIAKLSSSIAPQSGSTVSAIELDVTSSESIRLAAAQVEAAFGRVDVLVNNAGVVVQGDDRVQVLRQTLETNTVAVYAVTEAFRILLTTQPGSGLAKQKRMIVVSSDLGSLGLKGDPNYQHQLLPALEYRMSKAAVDMMVIHYHVHEGKAFKSFAWTPGFTATDLTGNVEERRQKGANDPDVVAAAFAKLVDGRVDEHVGRLVDEELKALPW